MITEAEIYDAGWLMLMASGTALSTGSGYIEIRGRSLLLLLIHYGRFILLRPVRHR